MHLLLIASAFLSYAAAQSNNTVASQTLTSSTSLSSSSIPGSTTAITVAQDGSGQFTAISPALSYAQNSGYPTVTIKAGTYSETVSVQATQTVTIVGENSSPGDYSQNRVTISHPLGPLTVASNNVQGISWRNINFVNSNTTGTAYAVSIRGTKNAFYDCSFVSAGQGAITSSLGITLISGGYIEGADKVFYSYPGMYVYGTTITALNSNALLVYTKGASINNVFYNSTIVFDTCSIVQKSGSSNGYVYLAAPNGAGSQAIFRNTSMAALVAPAGVHPTSSSYVDYYGEFETTGNGAFSANSASRSSYDHLMTADQMSQWTAGSVFADSFPPYATSDLGWIDQSVLIAIQNSESTQTSVASASTSSSTSSVSSTITSTAFLTTSSVFANNITASSIAVSTTSSAACAPSATLVVSKFPGACEYSNISAAIAALPNDNQAKTIEIKAGVYTEQVSISRNGKVTLIGETSAPQDYTSNNVTIQFSNGQLTSAGLDETTPVINAKKTNDNSCLAVYNINFVNTYPQTKNTAALAADFYGNNIAAYGCSFVGFQDTLLANKGIQVLSNSYIEGSIDFVWGFSTAYFHQCYIAINTPGACISAQSRSTSTSPGGYVFDSCYITGTKTYGSTLGLSYLGRPYSNFSIAVYMNSYIDSQINSAGWSVWQTNNPQTNGVLFGEYNNSGPSSWQSSTQRAPFATNLTSAQAQSYTLGAWIGDTSWLDQTAYNYIPSYTLTGPSTTTNTSSNSTTSIPSATASINAHPDSGTQAPAGAVLVSPNGQVKNSYANITAALASLPNDYTNQTLFIYAGAYTEQVPSINRPGAVRLIGYTTANPGYSYQNNTVTITFSRGLSVSPLPVGHSDAETATISTASNRISWYNINMINSDNLDGLESNYVTLAASIYGNDIGFYAVSMIGWQDTLLTGATNGYQYYENSYIEGAIDFIWGYSKAYFKGCTIAGKRASSAMTAQSRASATAIGGYIFDQCLFTAAADATVDLTQSIYLGRPYSAYALVVVKNSYLDKCIQPSGWKVWSTTDPRTDHITFAEYANVGPGAWQNNVPARQAFQNCTLLTTDTYPLASVMDSSNNVTVAGNSTYDGTTPPAGALVVSKTPIDGVTTYNTIQAALDAAPISSKTNATIFIHPGSYEEHLVVNKSGTTIFQGYSESTADYSSNKVTITFSYGVDTQSDESNSDSATVYATGNYFYAYNINFRNDNGTQQDIASLGFAVKSSKYASLYSCQVYGNQDTLLINGYLFAFQSYIAGSIDFIWGSGSGYFLNSTIAANEDDINITADKRATNTTQAGFVFDQCSIVPATGQSGLKRVGLGRPWNDLARVAYIDSYLDGMIEAAGWNQWSTSSPQTDQVTFAEYHNYGPGATVCNRANFSEQLTDSSVAQFQLGNFFTTTNWINFTRIDVQPFVPGIGSAPAPCASTTVSSTATIITSTSTSSVSSSTISSSTLPLTTIYTTKTVTDKETLITSFTSADVTSTATTVITQDAGSTITPAALTTTITGKESTTVLSTTSVAGKTSTVKATTTISLVSTLTPAPITITDDEGSTSTIIVTSSPKGSTTTLSTTITIAPTATKTVDGKASTISVTVTSIKTTTKASTTTLKCIPSVDSKVRRQLANQAAGHVTSTVYTTLLTYVKTSSVSLAGSTDYQTVTRTSTIGKLTTLKQSTVTSTITSFTTKSSVVTVSGGVGTSTSYKTSTIESTVTAARQTKTVVKSAITTVTSTSTIDPTTSTVYSTKTSSLKSATVTVTPPPSTKTTTLKSTSTIFVTSTKTSKNAPACTA
ncbi:hypothetical protein LTR78_001694 [Recurvomyces mirabilis]|uniref:pectinesterase n=1 Tax=Recurvomyces mirabilis TaxID=574656 RepID=A0AAE0WUX4_9PEZI|nr:hypothetical protein LTR78_001694 [Recurvomyces mirabilis]KAK5151736.1 hypothetical protein LTS14_008868 [Recurvomyces mirabilis]